MPSERQIEDTDHMMTDTAEDTSIRGLMAHQIKKSIRTQLSAQMKRIRKTKSKEISF